MFLATYEWEKPLFKSFLKTLPLGIFAVFLASLCFDLESRYLRLVTFVLYGALTFVRPSWGFFAIVASLGWYELPILQYGHPNQFLIETALIAFITVCTLKRGSGEVQANFKQIFRHPFFYPAVFAVAFTLICFAISFGEQASVSSLGVSKVTFLQTLLRKIFRWDVRSSVHSLSIVKGFLILLCFLARLFNDWRRFGLKNQSTLLALCVGAIPVFLFAIGQEKYPETFLQIFTSDIGGTFQNGNHLSFFSALVLVSCCQLASHPEPKAKDLPIVWHIAILSVALLATKSLLLGMGRSVWLACAFSFMTCLSIFVYRYGRSLGKSRVTLIGVLGGILASFILLLYVVKRMVAGCDISLNRLCFEIGSSLDNLNFDHFLAMLNESNRLKMLHFVREVFGTYPITGIGLGNNFVWLNLGLDLHNAYLAWLTELGVFGFAVLVLGSVPFCLYVLESLRSNLKPKDLLRQCLNLMLLLIVFFTCLVDYYLSYRSLLLCVAILLSSQLLSSETARNLNMKTHRVALILCLGLAIITSGWTLAFPQNRFPLDYANKVERDANDKKNFNWHNMVYFSDELQNQDGCSSVEVRSLLPHHASPLRVGLVHADITTTGLARISELNEWQKKNLLDYLDIQLFSDQWQRLCVCAKTSGKRIVLISHSSHIPSWTKSLPYDDRPLGFAVKDNSENKNRCSQIIKFN